MMIWLTMPGQTFLSAGGNTTWKKVWVQFSAKLMAASAFNRQESRGGHYRTDFTDQVESWKHRTFTTLADADRQAAEIAETKS